MGGVASSQAAKGDYPTACRYNTVQAQSVHRYVVLAYICVREDYPDSIITPRKQLEMGLSKQRVPRGLSDEFFISVEAALQGRAHRLVVAVCVSVVSAT